MELVARELAGQPPAAIRMRRAAKRLGRDYHVQVIAWLSHDELAALKAADPTSGRVAVGLDTLTPISTPTPLNRGETTVTGIGAVSPEDPGLTTLTHRFSHQEARNGLSA